MKRRWKTPSSPWSEPERRCDVQVDVRPAEIRTTLTVAASISTSDMLADPENDRVRHYRSMEPDMNRCKYGCTSNKPPIVCGDCRENVCAESRHTFYENGQRVCEGCKEFPPFFALPLRRSLFIGR